MRGATADMHCDGSRDLGWRETGDGVPVITVTAVLTVLFKGNIHPGRDRLHF